MENLNDYRNDSLSPPSAPEYVEPEVEDRHNLGNTMDGSAPPSPSM